MNSSKKKKKKKWLRHWFAFVSNFRDFLCMYFSVVSERGVSRHRSVTRYMITSCILEFPDELVQKKKKKNG